MIRNGLFQSILLHSTSFHSILLHSILFHSSLFHSILFHSSIFNSIPFHSNLFRLRSLKTLTCPCLELKLKRVIGPFGSLVHVSGTISLKTRLFPLKETVKTSRTT